MVVIGFTPEYQWRLVLEEEQITGIDSPDTALQQVEVYSIVVDETKSGCR
jgi:hypothetical protein